jgi:xylulokinase
MSLLGIDVGTTGCKAAIFSEEGQMLALAYEEYDVLRPQPGWAELDAAAVWGAVQRMVARAAAQVSSDPPRALCVSSLGEAVTPVSADRRILGNSLLNFDARGEEYLPALGQGIEPQRLYALNGNTLGNHYTLTKLKWVRQHQPELYRQAHRFLHWSGFVSFMLGAEAAVDYSLANRTLLFDLQRGDWDDELFAWAGLEREKLPHPVPTGTVIGRVSRQAAGGLGLRAGIPIVAGPHDQCANGIGCGVIQPGQAMYGMGTYFNILVTYPQRGDPQAMMARGLNSEHHAAPGLFVSFIYNHGGSLLKWYRDTFAYVEKHGAADSGELYAYLLSEMPAGPSPVICLPHFAPTGPPEFIADSSGVLAGLRLETRRGDILKGMLEGVIFYLRECVEALPGTGIAIHDFRAVGGGSRSEAWVQLSADILGQPFTRPRVNEAGVLGAAIIAGVGAGILPSFEDGVARMVQLERSFEPDPRRHAAYASRFERYKQLWPLLKDYLRAAPGE